MRWFDSSLFSGKAVFVADLDGSVVNNRGCRRQAEERGRRTQGREVDYDVFYDEGNLALDRPMQRNGLTHPNAFSSR